jgi:hypothetical protein
MKLRWRFGETSWLHFHGSRQRGTGNQQESNNRKSTPLPVPFLLVYNFAYLSVLNMEALQVRNRELFVSNSNRDTNSPDMFSCGGRGGSNHSLHKTAELVYLSNIPAIATENLLVLLLFSLFTTCFGPYGPSSGEILYITTPEDGP